MIKAVHKGKTSIREVASAAGVSVVTVSAALNGGKNVSERKRLEIQQLAREMGYKPNAAARLLKSKKIDDFGLLIFERVELIRENAMFMDFTVQFMRECARHEISFQTEWFDCYHNPDRIPAILTNGMVGGLLIAGAPDGASKDYIDHESRLPRVHVGEAGEYSVNMDPSEQFR